MKITEIIQPKLSSAIAESKTQNIVPQDIVSYNGHSGIMEGVSQILRRVKGKGLKAGFRCTSGPRKGRIVAKPSTCFAQRDVSKGAKISRKRQLKAKTAGKKMAITKRSGGASRRLKKIQTKTGSKIDRPRIKLSKKISSKRAPLKSKIIRPK